MSRGHSLSEDLLGRKRELERRRAGEVDVELDIRAVRLKSAAYAEEEEVEGVEFVARRLKRLALSV